MSTIIVLIILFVFVVLTILDRARLTSEKQNTKYKYAVKPLVMTEHEQKYFNILNDAVGDRYFVLAQAHLSAFLDEKVKGQSWKGAFRHINGKSIDFLLCEKTTLKPLLAVELDDKTHERSDRRLRDEEVERIFNDANLPLMRVESHGTATLDEVKARIQSLLA